MTTKQHFSPIVVDLDGTLILTDSLDEAYTRLCITNPFCALYSLRYLFRGRAAFKCHIHRVSPVPLGTIPYNEQLLVRLKAEARNGRRLLIATGAPHDFALKVSEHLGIFDDVFASNETENLTGSTKAVRLVREFGNHGFSYVGNAWNDLPVWQAADEAWISADSRRLHRALAKIQNNIVAIPTGRQRTFVAMLCALRPQQWVKNALIFVPLIAAQAWTDISLLALSVRTFFAFSLLTSLSYLINDLHDLDSDRSHPTKRTRPFASGSISMRHAAVLALIAGSASLYGFWGLPLLAGSIAGTYMLVSLAYSFALKKSPIVDVFILSCLYTARIAIGATAVCIHPSVWLFTFSTFSFFALALLKRVSDLVLLDRSGVLSAPGRSYRTSDTPVLVNLGVSSSMIASATLGLYFNSDSVRSLYLTPDFLWPILLIFLFWSSRLWLLATRGEIGADPISFALADKISYICLFVIAGCLLLALHHN